LKQIIFSYDTSYKSDGNIYRSNEKKKEYPIYKFCHIFYNSGEKIYCLKNK
ncbi:hypothetical protein ALC57_16558, partial [Trachymyrmex cornetzi]